MSVQPIQPDDAPGADAASDPAVQRAERRLRVLAELTEIGMELARGLTAGPVENAADAAGADKARARRRDPAEVFADLSRAIRLTVMLEARTDEALRDLVAGVARVRETTRVRIADEARDAEAQRRQDREERIQALVVDAASEQITGEADLERLDQELDERLLLDRAYWSDPARPLREVVERYCEWFGLTPDWSRWLGDGWAPPRTPPVWPWAVRAETTGPP